MVVILPIRKKTKEEKTLIPKFTKFPIKHIDGNLIIGEDGTRWLYFLVKGYNYDLRDEAGKLAPFYSQMNFFRHNKGDIHMQTVPIPTDTDTIINETIDRLKDKDYPLQRHGIAYFNELKKALKQNNVQHDTTEYHDIIGIQIKKGKNHVKDMNAGNEMFQSMGEFVKGLKSPLYQAFGLKTSDILQKEIDECHKQSKDIMKELKKAFKCEVKELTAKQVVYFIEQNFSVGRKEIQYKENFSSAEIVTGTDQSGKTHKAKRPNPKAFFNLQDAEVQEIDRRTLLVQRLVDNDIEESYVRHLVCTDIPAMPEHPGFEWLYEVRNKLTFPISVSIRAHHVTNDKTIKALSNALLDIKDQRNEAKKAGETTEDHVNEVETGAKRMQTIFKKNGWPSYNCSILFKISAKDKETLDSQTKELIDEMNTYGMTLMSPFGEQLNFFYESIIGSKRFSRDYNMKVAPQFLSGLMFAATAHIGDNRGMYFAQTLRQNRPVFLQMDLAAKNYKHIKNMFDSISIMVAGMTGKGKSVLMNLLTYLSVLMGSLALIVDPKGDRRKWVDGLPFIPKEFISVWELGKHEEDIGCLDPWRICMTPEEARDLCIENVSHMADIKVGSLTFTLLSKYVDEVSKQEEPCMGALAAHLLELEDKILEEKANDPRAEAILHLSGTLQSIKGHSLGKLMFSEVGQKTRSLQVDKPLQVLMVQNLQLPKKGEPANTPAGKFSEMVMLSLTAFAKQYMLKQDRSIHKIILQDEAASIERSATGSVLLDFVVTQGRHYNTSLVKGTQNASTFGSDSNNIGMKFSFALPNREEAMKMLEFMNLPLTEENITTLQTLERGEALYQDIFGRCALTYIDTVFTEIFDAFDSSTSTKEERQAEEEREREKVGA